MTLFELAADAIRPVAETSFSIHGVRERMDLQRLLRDRIDILDRSAYVVSEEFGSWEDSRRRIDLLCIDQDANLVVVELKRDETGGHMELQALRYAAMVSKMTFAQVVSAHADYLQRRGLEQDAREAILQFLEWETPDEEHFAQAIRIVLGSAEFSRELTTSVLWLNEQGLDIRCIRLKPYQLDGRLLLDVQQIIPLQEAADYQVRVREKEREERATRLAGTVGRESDEAIAARVKTEFLRHAITGVEVWVDQLREAGHLQFELRHHSASRHSIRIHGKNQLGYTFTELSLSCVLYDPTPDEIGLLQTRLANKEVTRRETGQLRDRVWRFYVVNDGDLDLVKEILLGRLKGAQVARGETLA